VQNLVHEAVTLSIEGMTCSGCAKAVTRALSQVPGVTAVAVDLGTGQARIEGGARPQHLVAAVEQAGFDVRRA
jgi:copper chaperone CopZ